MGARGIGAKKTIQVTENYVDVWQDKEIPLLDRIFDFCNHLPITSGLLAGQNLTLQDWQKDWLEKVYATDSTGKRKVRSALLSVPRKSGKSTLCAALALAHLCGPLAEQRGQVYSAASDRNQAAIIFREMVAIIERVPWLESRLVVKTVQKEIRDVVTGSIYQALSSDARKAHGLSPSCVICDEVAQWKGRELYDNLITGMGARAEPLCIVIGTQSASDASLMSELVDYSLKVDTREIVDEAFAGTVYAAPDDADPWDENVWLACNPALVSGFKSMEDMRIQAAQARNMPARAGSFRNLQLNQRVDAEQHFLSRDAWVACRAEYTNDQLAGETCFAGMDLSATNDLSALVLYFPESGCVLPYFWLPADDIGEREQEAHVPYRSWVRQHFLEKTPGKVVDYAFIAQRLADVCSRYDVQGIAYDRWRIKDLQKALADDMGADENEVNRLLVPHGQGYRDMAPAVDALERAIVSQSLHHDGNPVLTWNVSNARTVEDPAGNRKIVKARGSEKIDGCVALAMAVGLASSMQTKDNTPISAEDIFFI